MSLILYAYPPSPRTFKMLFALHHMDIAYTLKAVDIYKGEQRDPAMMSRNPNARVPVIEDDGFVLWESNAILEYLATTHGKTGMLPADPKAQAQVRKWLFWESSHFDPACSVFIFERLVKSVLGQGKADPKEIARAEQIMHSLGPVLDGVLAGQRYVAGDTLTLADIALGAHLTMSEAAQFPLHPHRNIARWQIELTSLPAWCDARAVQIKYAG